VRKRALTLRDRAWSPELHNPEPVRHLIGQVDALLAEPIPLWSFARLSEWWFGSRIEQAWAQLHEADLLIAKGATGRLFQEVLDEGMQYADQLPANDPTRIRLTEYAGTLGKGVPAAPTAAPTAGPAPAPHAHTPAPHAPPAGPAAPTPTPPPAGPANG